MDINYKAEAFSRIKRFEYIPIDFIKCKLINFSIDKLFNNHLLDFRSLVNRETGEFKPRRVAYHKNLKFTIHDSGLMELSGSIHKYFNEGLHNHNAFSYSDYKSALKRIYEDFGIAPENMWIQNLEYGVNITPPINCNLILNNSFLHKKLPISKPLNNQNGHYIQANHKGNYLLKVYDKAKQYRPIYNELKNTEILRIEIKQIRWSKYRKGGIRTLEDFNTSDKTIFINDLINKWGQLVFFNPLSQNKNYSNPFSNFNYWISLLKKNPNELYRKIRELKMKNNEKCLDIQEKIIEQIIEKISYLNMK